MSCVVTPTTDVVSWMTVVVSYYGVIVCLSLTGTRRKRK